MPNVLNIWNLLLLEKKTNPNDLGFEKIADELYKNMKKMGIDIGPNKSVSFLSKILGLLYFILAVLMYYMIINMNTKSEMMQYIAISAYTWTIMLGFILLLS